MRRLDGLDWTAITLTIIGALNWGLIGLFNFNLVDTLFGVGSWLSRIIYTLVGISGLYLIYTASKMSDRDRVRE
ncbi:membrane protein [Fervidicella metallireducens AeB]|uniref:Membrane protein n=1 Tax=Fervidicella metallireducens AeB TaxID=1403537 RepID=A0A017RXE7_9CLOT|nr:DUF378 domain-containing protein [Fervidicella metallireducens]EYE88590.1 membrane protein [Fervidicella metallireducens AeB]